MKRSIVMLLMGAAFGTLLMVGFKFAFSKPSQPDIKEPEPPVFDPKLIKFQGIKSGETGIQVTVIDSCQYIIIESYHKVAIIHKANCFNPNH
jgi:hypothetical protein